MLRVKSSYHYMLFKLSDENLLILKIIVVSYNIFNKYIIIENCQGIKYCNELPSVLP
jgi:hypothetical protein